MTTGDYVLRFGKHKGEPLSEIPTEYLDWLLGKDFVWPEVKDAIVAHLRTRADWQNLGE